MPKKWRRALVQLGVVAVYSTYKYWREYHEWIEDWQFELTFADQYRRFLTTEAIRFDSNAYITNWTHVLGGALYYEMARTNYLTWAESADSRTRFLFQAGWRLPSAPVRVFIGLEGIHRWGRIGDVTAASQETRTSAGLSYRF